MLKMGMYCSLVLCFGGFLALNVDGVDSVSPDVAASVQGAGTCIGYEYFTHLDQCDQLWDEEAQAYSWICGGEDNGYDGHWNRWNGAELEYDVCGSGCSGSLYAYRPDCAAQ